MSYLLIGLNLLLLLRKQLVNLSNSCYCKDFSGLAKAVIQCSCNFLQPGKRMGFNKHSSTKQMQQNQVHFHAYKCITLLLWEHVC